MHYLCFQLLGPISPLFLNLKQEEKKSFPLRSVVSIMQGYFKWSGGGGDVTVHIMIVFSSALTLEITIIQVYILVSFWFLFLNSTKKKNPVSFPSVQHHKLPLIIIFTYFSRSPRPSYKILNNPLHQKQGFVHERQIGRGRPDLLAEYPVQERIIISMARSTVFKPFIFWAFLSSIWRRTKWRITWNSKKIMLALSKSVLYHNDKLSFFLFIIES